MLKEASGSWKGEGAGGRFRPGLGALNAGAGIDGLVA